MHLPLRGIGRLVPGFARTIRLAALIAAARTPIFVAVPLSVRAIFDDAIPDRDGTLIAQLGLVMLALYVIDAALVLVLRRIAARFATRAVADVRANAIARLHALPRSWHDGRDPGLLHALVMQDCERLLVVLSQVTGWVVPTAVTFLALSVVATVLSPPLAGLVGGALVVVLCGVVPIARATVHEGRRSADALRSLSAGWRTALRLLPATQAHGAEQSALLRAADSVGAVESAALQLQITQSRLIACVDLATAVIAAATLIAGGVGITSGWLTVGSMLSFYAVGILLLRQFSLAAPGVASTLSDSSSIGRLVDLLDTAESPPYRGSRPHVPLGKIELAGVRFAYADTPVLREVSLVIEPGDHVAILGPNGAGKSTLVNLLLGTHRPDAGTILIDDLPMDELEIRTLRRGIGLALQDPILFRGTIAENIAYARPDATREEILRAAEQSTVARFLPALPLGLDTQVGDEGVGLSGGQRQRIAVARALLGSPRLIILDEPSTYLDTEAIDELLDRLERLPASPTVVTITHDLHVAEQAHRIVHLRDGRIELIEQRVAQSASRRG